MNVGKRERERGAAILRTARLLERECQAVGWRWQGGEQRHGVWEWTVTVDLHERGVHWLRLAVVEDYPDEPPGAEPWLTAEIWEGLQRGDRFGRRDLGHLTVESWTRFEGVVLTFRSACRRHLGEPDDQILRRRSAPPPPTGDPRTDGERAHATAVWLRGS